MNEYLEGAVLGYVVVEWNQASHQPGIPYSDLHADKANAQHELDARKAQTDKVGRRERYTIAALIEIEADE